MLRCYLYTLNTSSFHMVNVLGRIMYDSLNIILNLHTVQQGMFQTKCKFSIYMKCKASEKYPQLEAGH